MVSSSEFVVNLRDSTYAFRKVAEQVGGNDGVLAKLARSQFARASMQVDGACDRAPGITWKLRHQTGDHSSEDVAGAASRHCRCARGVDPCLAVRPRDNGGFTF